ncbi:universal stress protein family-domain-containing protein [Chytriomyces sp. MP71]|nr:universal stress protein family-domain-containing protein [Chytriomyces sp. MP71]
MEAESDERLLGTQSQSSAHQEGLVTIPEAPNPTQIQSLPAKKIGELSFASPFTAPLPSPNSLRRAFTDRIMAMNDNTHEEISEDLNLDLWKKNTTSRIIAVALDGSGDGDKAFFWALNNMIKNSVNINNKIILLTCRSANSTDTNRLEALTLLRSKLQLIKAANIVNTPVRAIILKGDVRHEITDVIEKLGVDILVIGTRGLGLVKRSVLGSVSDYLSKNSHCTCIIAK